MRTADLPFFDAPFLAFAHRGGGVTPADLPRENTLHAFTAAAELGFAYLETDVHLTRDGVLVAFHDDRLERVTDRSGLVSELPWADIQRARIADRDPIPTLAQVLEAVPTARFNIDAKADAAVDPLVETIAEHEAWDRVNVTSFGVSRLHRLRRRLRHRLGPRRLVASSVSSMGVAWSRFVPALPAAVHSSGCALQIPARQTLAGRQVEIVTEALVERAHRAGQQVHVWTVNDAAEMNRLIDLGVDGLIGDRLDTLVEVLTRRGLWR